MHTRQLERILRHPDFQALVAGRTRLCWALTFVMLVTYFGFILTLAFFPSTLGAPLAGAAITVGIPVGVGVILIAFALTGIYVAQANRLFDALNEKVLKECEA